MSDFPQPPARRRRFAAVTLAALAGIALGVGAVYVSGGFSGNARAGECELAAQNASDLSDVATGTLAGFTPAANAADLSGLTFLDSERNQVTLADFSGKTVLLNLWATWCAPCRAEMPSLDNLEEVRGSDAFQVVAVSVDTKTDGRAERFYAETGIDDLAFFVEPTLTLFNTLKDNGLAYGMPTTLLVDGNGCHIGSLNGPAEWDAPEALALVDAALADRDPASSE